MNKCFENKEPYLFTRRHGTSIFPFHKLEDITKVIILIFAIWLELIYFLFCRNLNAFELNLFNNYEKFVEMVI